MIDRLGGFPKFKAPDDQSKLNWYEIKIVWSRTIVCGISCTN